VDSPENGLVELNLSDVELKCNHGYFADKESKKVLLGLGNKAQQATTKVKMVRTWKAKRVTQILLRR
jgi:hypothetical protein